MLNNWNAYYSLPPSGTLTEFTIRTEGGDILFEDRKERDSVVRRRHCTTEFVLSGDDYDTFNTIFAADPCDEVYIHLYYDGSEVWVGNLNYKKAKKFPDTCQIHFTPDVIDDYNCIFRSWEDEVNIFSAGSTVEVETFLGTIVEVTCGPVNEATPIQINGYFELNVNACLSGNDAAYTLLRAYIEEVSPGTSYNHYATFVTELVTTTCSGGLPVPPPGDGWVLIDNDCAGSGQASYGRPVQVNYVGERSATTGKYWDNTYEVVGEGRDSYGNGILLSDILDELVSDCSLSVVSDFFDINPDASAPSNDAYTASDALHSIVVYQKSDIKRPDADTPATVGFITLKDLLEYLRLMFNVYWRVEGSDMRLEHISYYEGTNGVDLTSTQPTVVANRNSHTHDNDKLAPREQFSWMDATTDADFKGLDIVYPSQCVDPDLSPVPISVGQVFTDLGKVQQDTDNVSDEGFFFMATDLVSGTYYMNREFGAISNQIKANTHLSWANLHENYLTWDRLQATGRLNNVSQTFNSYQRSKRQQPLPVVFSVAVYFALDLTDKLNTGLGWGEIDKGTYSAASCRYNVELLHDD